MSDTDPGTGAETPDTADTAPDNDTSGQHQDDADTVVDWEQEATKWKSLARKHEKTAKTATSLQRELDSTRQSNMTDQERAVEAARAEARTEALKASGERLARSEIKAALTGLIDNPADIIEDLNLSRYVTEDGEVDEDAVDALKARYTAALGRRSARQGGTAGHGRSGGGSKTETVADQFGSFLEGQLNKS